MPLCRACLTERESFLHELFYDVSADMYSYCTSIEVNMKEGYPLGICDLCFDLLKQLSEFKRTCNNSQNILSMSKPFIQEQYDELNKSTLLREDWKPGIAIVDDLRENLYNDELNVDYEPHDSEEQDVKCKIEIHPETINKQNISNKIKKIKLNRDPCVGKNRKLKRKRPYLSCNLCRKKFILIERLEAHKLEHAGESVTIACTLCDKSFATWVSLNRHKKDEHTVYPLKSLKCNICGRISKSPAALQTHKYQHRKRSKQFCHICGKGFSTHTTLKTHMSVHSDTKERQYTCEQCGKKFATERYLKFHIWRAHSTRKYICDCCNFSFKHKYGLVMHLKTQGGKGKVYKCDICDKAYSRQSTLNEHKNLHSGVRPFACNFCSKSFTTKRTLYGHEKIHTGEKPYKCQICEKTFSQSSSLRRHFNVHNKENKIDK